MTSVQAVTDTLSRLVAFDTTSRGSNLELIDWVEDQVGPFASMVRRLPNADGGKANLWVRIGPDAPGGVVLSGHTDVVPVDGQPWTSDPWTLTERGGRLYGRGSSDMKGFIALALAHAGAFAGAGLKRPVHLALSYDEEIGCAGVTPMIEEIARSSAAPALVWVGEPTLWGVVAGHKGIRTHEVVVTGHEAHSSAPRKGASAIHEAIGLLHGLMEIAAKLEREAGDVEPGGFDPPHATLTVGVLQGGTAGNILARRCRFEFDLRCRPEDDPDLILAPFLDQLANADARLRRWGEACGARMTRHADAPPLRPEWDGPAERFLRELTGDNARRTAAYATEAGQFDVRHIPAAVCGPGSIEQAHQPDEWIAVSELERGLPLMARLIDRLRM
ncbi:acetylornithine deacetylase [bacterium]|nr:acetylornithine deacetylase [bacterium]